MCVETKSVTASSFSSGFFFIYLADFGVLMQYYGLSIR